MRQVLKLHPDSRCDAVTRIEVDVARPRPGNLVLHYLLTGKMSDLCLPPVTVSTRTDELWRRTCFEAFVRAVPGDAYCEFNFAPSTQWAAYRFDGYRNGMAAASEMSAPDIAVQSNGARCELQVALDLDRLPDLRGGKAWRLALSAVIEEMSGRISYWALAHPPGRADFHHSDGFALELPEPERS